MNAAKQSHSFGKLVDHLQTFIRELISPLDHVAALIPDGDNLLELGCGQGILMRKLVHRIGTMTGVDYDPRKCQMVKEWCEGFPGVQIVQGDILGFLATVADGSREIVVLSDTLASNNPDNQEKIMLECARIIQPQGTLLLKIMDVEPKWKFRISLLISNLVYKILRLSVSNNQQLYHRSSRDYVIRLQALGFSAQVVYLHRIHHSPLSHCVILGKKL